MSGSLYSLFCLFDDFLPQLLCNEQVLAVFLNRLNEFVSEDSALIAEAVIQKVLVNLIRELFDPFQVIEYVLDLR